MQQRSDEAWHALDAMAVVAAVGSDATHGLTLDEAARRVAQYGPNELQKGEPVSALAIFLGQFRSLVIWVLIGAAVVSAVVGELTDGIAIVAIVVLNAVIGFFQEYRAEQAVTALARLAAPRAKVLRDGSAQVVAAVEIVRGDVLLLEAGDLVPADARLLESAALAAAEAPLTGESEPVRKTAAACTPDTALADRRDMVFLGTSITNGTGRAVVVATGMATEVGHIATLLETASAETTPLQTNLDQVGRRLLTACLAIVVVVFVLGMLRGVAPFEMFLAAVSLAVAAVPEGLPAVVTVALALGVQRMVRRHALIRHLPAVETLGCAQVICTDKTGTLTVGEMTARRVVTSGYVFSTTGEGYATDGTFFTEAGERAPADDPVLADLLFAAAACNDAELATRGGKTEVVGDPTEGALLVLAAKGNVTRVAIESAMPRVGVMPFDSERKRMTVIREGSGSLRAITKGAPEIVVARCASVRTPEGIVPLSDAVRAQVLGAASLLGNEALRVMALASRPLDDWPIPDDEVERDLTLLGLVGLQDPPRAEARDSVAKCKAAGIRVVMITGDHPDTARAIARELGILDRGDQVIVGRDLEEMNDQTLVARVERAAVYARVTAEHKLRIVRAWKARGAVVAMTGDGVNDAPALKAASIGIAMGRSGTEVTKQAADMIVTDDNFASIVAAVEEGRGIYDNITKTLGYLLAGNAGELAVMLIAALVGWPLPLLPIQLLWINLVTDGLPALGLATDPIDPDVLSRPPRRPDAELMDRHFIAQLAFIGCLTATVTLAAFAYELWVDGNLEDARDAAFSVLVIAELLRAFGARSATRTVWDVGLFSNLRLFVIVSVSFWLQIAIHHQPTLARFFGTEPISLTQCIAWIVLGALPLAVIEGQKLVRRRHELGLRLQHDAPGHA